MNNKPPLLPLREVKCPGCGGISLYAAHNPYRPFCSERCKNIDLGAWASESFRLDAKEPSEDADLSALEGITPSNPVLRH
jgi:endogenous inhibitor of DNA gyrase (YacG/DUF329 family)